MTFFERVASQQNMTVQDVRNVFMSAALYGGYDYDAAKGFVNQIEQQGLRLHRATKRLQPLDARGHFVGLFRR